MGSHSAHGEGAADRDPAAWFEDVYAAAGGEQSAVPWSSGGPHPSLVEWAERGRIRGEGRRALIVGCGLGDDAEYVAGLGFDTDAFDVSPSAIQGARQRFPGSQVRYHVADLRHPPAGWRLAFDLVVEVHTLQSLPTPQRPGAVAGLRALVAAGGTLLAVAAHAKEPPTNGPPWPLTRADVAAIAGDGLRLVGVEESADGRRLRAELRREPALVFVHSPLVGPLTWRDVAGRFAACGWRTAVPDLTGVLAGGGPYHPAIALQVAAAADPLDGPVVLIGHSGAGPLLPGIAATVRGPVAALVYVDAGLPSPGHTWFETAPDDLAANLRSLSDGGRLPPWHEWFPAQTVAELLPDPQLRARFAAEIPSLPLAYFEERSAARAWSGPSGHLVLTDRYRGDARSAADQGASLVELPSNHLAMITVPDSVADALGELLDQLIVADGAPPAAA